jgi:hypothetical protein
LAAVVKGGVDGYAEAMFDVGCCGCEAEVAVDNGEIRDGAEVK